MRRPARAPSAENEYEMRRIVHSIASLVLGLAFIAAMAATGCAVRYYDADHRDYHRWDGDEDRAYRVYWGEAHPREPYRDYGRVNGDEQRNYWNWRHGHPDAGRGDNRNRDNRDRDDRDRR
jgi:hypothetical protein